MGDQGDQEGREKPSSGSSVVDAQWPSTDAVLGMGTLEVEELFYGA